MPDAVQTIHGEPKAVIQNLVRFVRLDYATMSVSKGHRPSDALTSSRPAPWRHQYRADISFLSSQDGRQWHGGRPISIQEVQRCRPNPFGHAGNRDALSWSPMATATDTGPKKPSEARNPSSGVGCMARTPGSGSGRSSFSTSRFAGSAQNTASDNVLRMWTTF